jgi:hypothetical protein
MPAAAANMATSAANRVFLVFMLILTTFSTCFTDNVARKVAHILDQFTGD